MSITSEGQESIDSLNGKLTFEQDKNRIVGRDGDNIIRLLILSDGVNFLMKVSKDGFDALTATDDQLIFSSNRNMFKIVDIRNINLSIPLSGGSGSFGTTTVAHGLGYLPAYEAFITIDSALAAFGGGTQNGPNPMIVNAISGTTVITYGVSQVTVDATNIKFTTYLGVTGASTMNFSAKVYLFRETAI